SPFSNTVFRFPPTVSVRMNSPRHSSKSSRKSSRLRCSRLFPSLTSAKSSNGTTASEPFASHLRSFSFSTDGSAQLRENRLWSPDHDFLQVRKMQQRRPFQRYSQAACHPVFGQLRRCGLQGPWRMMDLATQQGQIPSLGIQTISLRQEVLQGSRLCMKT